MTEPPEDEPPAQLPGRRVNRRTVLQTAALVATAPSKAAALLEVATAPPAATTVATAAVATSPFTASVPFAPAVATLFGQGFQELINSGHVNVVDKENDDTIKPYGQALADIIIQKRRGAPREALAPLTQRFLESMPELGRKIAANIPGPIRRHRITHQIVDDAGSDRECTAGSPPDHAGKLIAAIKEVGDFLDSKALEILEEGVRNGDIENRTPAGQEQVHGTYNAYHQFRYLMRNWSNNYKVTDPSGNTRLQLKAKLQPAVDMANERLANIAATLTGGTPEEQRKSVLVDLFGDMIIDHNMLFSPSGVLDENILKRSFAHPKERYTGIASTTLKKPVTELLGKEFSEEYTSQDYMRDMGELFNPAGSEREFEWERILQRQFNAGFNMSFQQPETREKQPPEKPSATEGMSPYEMMEHIGRGVGLAQHACFEAQETARREQAAPKPQR